MPAKLRRCTTTPLFLFVFLICTLPWSHSETETCPNNKNSNSNTQHHPSSKMTDDLPRWELNDRFGFASPLDDDAPAEEAAAEAPAKKKRATKKAAEGDEG